MFLPIARFRIFQDHSQYRSNKCCVRHWPTIKFCTIEQSNFVFSFCQLFLGGGKLNVSFDISFDIAFDGEVTLYFTAEVHEYVTETVTQLPTRAKASPQFSEVRSSSHHMSNMTFFLYQYLNQQGRS